MRRLPVAALLVISAAHLSGAGWLAHQAIAHAPAPQPCHEHDSHPPCEDAPAPAEDECAPCEALSARPTASVEASDALVVDLHPVQTIVPDTPLRPAIETQRLPIPRGPPLSNH